MILVPEYEVSLESTGGDLRYVLTFGQPAIVPEDYYYEHLMNMLLMIISKDAELIKKKYC